MAHGRGTPAGVVEDWDRPVHPGRATALESGAIRASVGRGVVDGEFGDEPIVMFGPASEAEDEVGLGAVGALKGEAVGGGAGRDAFFVGGGEEAGTTN